MDNQYKERNRKIFLERMSGDKTLLQLSLEYDISKDRVSQIVIKEAESFYKLKDSIQSIKDNFHFLQNNILSIQSEVAHISIGKFFMYEDTEEPCEHSIKYLELSVRSHNALLDAGIKTIDQLCKHSKFDLLIIPNFGRKSLMDVERALGHKGRSLSDLRLKLKK